MLMNEAFVRGERRKEELGRERVTPGWSTKALPKTMKGMSRSATFRSGKKMRGANSTLFVRCSFKGGKAVWVWRSALKAGNQDLAEAVRESPDLARPNSMMPSGVVSSQINCRTSMPTRSMS